MVVNDVSSIVSKNRNVSDGKLLPICINAKMSLQLVNRSTMVRSCSDDCWDEFIGFWIEGCLVPVIAAFGIVGGW